LKIKLRYEFGIPWKLIQKWVHHQRETEAIKTKQGAIDKNLRMNRMISTKKSIMNVLIQFQEISHEDRQLFDELVDSFN
jgi:hypothetical protein